MNSHRLRSWMVNRFGLKNCALKNQLWNVFWMMRCLTIDLDSNNQRRMSGFAYGFGAASLACYLYCYQLSFLYNCVWRTPPLDNTSLLIITSLSMSSNISTVKLVYMFIHRRNLMSIIDAFRSIDNQVDPFSRYCSSMLSRLRDVKKRALLFWCSFVSGSLAYVTLPLLKPGRHLPENSLNLFGLEPMFESPNYEIVYTILVIGGVEATLVPSNVTVLLIVLVGYVEAHVAALTVEFHNLWTDVVASSRPVPQYVGSNIADFSFGQTLKETDRKINDIVKGKLKFLINRHADFVILHQRIGVLFERIILFEFSLTVISLCAILLGGLEKTYIQIPYSICQLVVDSLIGQRLLDAAVLLERSIYDCGWENFDSSNMKSVQVILQCSQKPLKLTAGGITTLCFESFMSITRSVYSAYATLSKTVK